MTPPTSMPSGGLVDGVVKRELVKGWRGAKGVAIYYQKKKGRQIGNPLKKTIVAV